MRAQLIMVYLLLISIAPAGAASEGGTSIEFGVPAQFAGTNEEGNWSWVALVFAPGSPFRANGTLLSTSTEIRHEQEVLLVEERIGPDGIVQVPVRTEARTSQIQAGGQFSLRGLESGWSTLLLHGDAIRLRVDGGQVDLSLLEDGCRAWNDSIQQGKERGFREPVCPAKPVVTQVGRFHYEPVDIEIFAEQVGKIEWHGMEVQCQGASPCPSRAETESHSVSMGPDQVTQRIFRWTTIEEAEGFALTGRPVEVFALGNNVRIQLDGQIRLPNARPQSCGGTCFLTPDATLSAEGRFEFWGLDPTQDGTLSGGISGDADWLREDEEFLDPQIFGTGAVVAGSTAVISLIGALKFLSPLFTRISGEKALEHPRRRLLLEYICENPGATFREVVRETDIPAGTARHHLTILRRSGLLAEHRHRSTLRFFENHGRFDGTWDAVVLRREPPLRVLHDWLLDNPLSPQKSILAAMEGRGWSRSTTQHRLNRLLDGGLVSVRPQGRRKLYEAHENPRQGLRSGCWQGLGGTAYS